MPHIMCVGKKQDGRLIMFMGNRGEAMYDRSVRDICEREISRCEYYKRTGVDHIPVNVVETILRDILQAYSFDEDDGK